MAVLEPSRLNIKVQEICAQLKELALQQGPGAKLPTTRQLCQLLATNPTTLNDALKQLETQDVISRRQGSGIFVSPRLHRKCITILFCARLCIANAASPFWGMIWSLFASEMERRNTGGEQYCSFHLVLDLPGGETTLPPGTLTLPESVINEVLQEKVHGVLSVGMEATAYNWLTEHRVPSVTFAGLGTCKVILDGPNSTSMGAQALIERGCHAPEMWQPYSPQPDATITAIWRETMSQAGYLESASRIRNAAAILRAPYQVNDYQEQGYRLAMDVFTQEPQTRPDGIFISNDLMTAGALCALEELEIRVGKDVHLVSHANMGSPMLPDIRAREITLLEADPELIVQTMFSQLDHLLLGQDMVEDAVYIPFHKRYARRPR